MVYNKNILIKTDGCEMEHVDNIKSVRPDDRGRINLGVLAKGVSRYDIIEGDNGSITLIPFVEISKREAWLFNNKEALDSVIQGFKSAEAGNKRELDLDNL